MSKRRKSSDRAKVEDWLIENYDFHFNLVLQMPYFKEKDEDNYRPVTDREFNNIYRNIQLESDLDVSVSELKIILNSNFTKEVHPVREYFKMLETQYTNIAGTAEIEKLASTLTLESTYEKRKVEDVFTGFLINWFTASVAQSMTDNGCQNQMCLVLLGEEGVKKTTWLSKLFPAALADYCKTSKIDMQKIDIWLDLGRMFIYNIDDQLRNLQRRDSETMKTIITQPHDYKRLPHATFNTFIPRLANFVGSINGKEFLSDVGRNRRYFPFTVLAINYAVLDTVDINRCWAEAFALFKSGVRYWYEPNELEQFDTNSYRTKYEEEELLFEYFEPLSDRNLIDSRTIYKSTTELLAELQRLSGLHNLSKKRLGEVLHTGIKCVTRKRENETGSRVDKWCLRRITEEEANAAARPAIAAPEPVKVPRKKYVTTSFPGSDLPIPEPNF